MSWWLLAGVLVALSDAAPPREAPPVSGRPPAFAAAPPEFSGDEDFDPQYIDIDGRDALPRFRQVAPGVYRSGQPNREGLAYVAKLGVKTVLSLRFWRARGEAAEVRRLGMTSLSAPMKGYEYPSFWRVDRALEILADPKRQPVLVHCAHGRDRTGAVIAAYRVVYEDADVAAAAAEARAIGCCPPVFGDIEPWLRRYARYRRGEPPDPKDGPGEVAGRLMLPDAAAGFDLKDPPASFDGAPGRGRASAEAVEAAPRSGTAGRFSPALAPGGAPDPEPPGPGRLTPARRAALVKRAIETLEGNRESFPSPNGRVRFTAPDKDRYPYQWLWDSSFHAIGLRHVDPARAADELKSLLAGQWDNGMIPNMVHARADVLAKRHAKAAGRAFLEWRPLEAVKEARKAAGMWLQDRFLGFAHDGKRRTSGITQPPIVAEAALAVAEKLGAEAGHEFLAEVYPALRRHFDWIDRERVKDGLMVIYHSWESGTDNSPRFDPIYPQEPGRFKEWWFNLTKKLPAIRALKKNGWRSSERFAAKSADMNSYYSENLRALAEIARRVGRAGEAPELESRAESVRRNILEQLWDESRSGFRDLGLVDGEWKRLPAATTMDFMPLYAGVLDPGDPRVGALVSQLTDPERFWTPYPLPTVSRQEPSFDPKGYWRGTSWVNINYLLARGLIRYGRAAEARELIERTLAMIERGGLREYYDPNTAEGQRGKDFGWTSALVIELDAMLDALPPSR